MLIPIAIALVAWIALQYRPSPHDQLAKLRHFVAHNFSVHEEIHINAGNRGLLLPDVVAAAQMQLDFRLLTAGVPLKFTLVDQLPTRIAASTETQPIPGATATASEEVLTADLAPRKDSSDATDAQPRRPLTLFIRRLDLYFHDTPHLWLDLYEPRAMLAYNLDQVHRNDVPFFMAQVLYDTLLEPDLAMWKQILTPGRKFADYRREVRVNFVAAEESGESPPDIIAGIKKYMARYALVEPFIRINSSVQILDVSRRHAAAYLTRNSTHDLTFFYLTTLKPYTNSVGGVQLYHMAPEPPAQAPPLDHYGTEYQAYQKRLDTTVYNISGFLQFVSLEIAKFVGLPDSTTANLVLRSTSAMKHHTIMGIRECLDLLLAPGNYRREVFAQVCQLVDTIMTSRYHDWASHLSRVYDLHRELSDRELSHRKA
ncbi:hypothetical protein METBISCDRAFT_25022 [Metschnikowia bicuspidata]|uniref:Uncharacterized protein n=1 Tax=Metschnikowia bicuspidata TaxID=27322 RepID=A0A4P9Z6X9_9ASCO|nr:hypothetical protein METBISCDRAFT_25022 [Metschnikowia bicuspidata]